MEALRPDPTYDPETVEEIDAAAGADAPTEWVPEENDAAIVSRYLRAHRYYAAECSRVLAAAQAERERVNVWEQRHLSRHDNGLRYIAHILGLYLRSTGQRKVDLPAGVISWRKGRERVEIPDPAAFVAAHRGTDLVRTKEEPDKAAVMAVVKNTGEIPACADIVRGDDTLNISTE